MAPAAAAGALRLLFLVAGARAAAAAAGPTAVCPKTMAVGQTHSCFVSDLSGGGVASVEVGRPGVAQAVATASPASASPGLFTFALPADLALGAYEVRIKSGADGAQVKRVEVSLVGEAAMVLLEMDKALYKPGQTAHLRALALRPAALTPLAGRVIELVVRSPKGLGLMKVEEATDASGVARFEFPIAAEPLLGAHTARATAKGGSGDAAVAEAAFGVEEYVLPRFEVNVSCDQSHVQSGGGSGSGTVAITGRAVAKYTFGEGVRGAVIVSVLAKSDAMSMMPAVRLAGGPAGEPGADSGGETFTALATVDGLQLSSSGEVEFKVGIPQSSLRPGATLLIEAAVVDAATGERQIGTTSLPVVYLGSSLHPNLATTDGSDLFRPGLPLRVRVELTLPGGGPPSQQVLRSGSIELVGTSSYVDRSKPTKETKVALDPSAFLGGAAAVVELPLPQDDASCCDPLAKPATEQEYTAKMGCCAARVEVHVRLASDRLWAAEPEGVATLCTSRAYSPSGVFLGVEPPAAGSDAARLRFTVDAASLQTPLSYFVLQSGAVVRSGAAPLGSVAQAGAFFEATLPVDIPADAAGACKLVVVARTAAGVAVTGSAAFERELVWPFALSASFSEAEVRPGASLSVNFSAVGAQAPAHVFFASLDRSAELLGARAAIGAPSVLAGLRRMADSSAAPGVAPRVWSQCHRLGADAAISAELADAPLALLEDGDASAPAPADPDKSWGPSLGEHCPRPIYSSCANGADAVDDMIMVRAAVMESAEMSSAVPPSSGAAAAPAAKETKSVAVRRFFPETWLWHDQALVSSAPQASAGSKVVTAPDTITTWSLEAFATTPEGLAAVRAERPLRVFKPLFVEVRLPASAIRGESLEVTIAVFNYADGQPTLTSNVQVALPAGLALASGERSTTLSVPLGSATTRVVVRPIELGTLRLTVTATAPGFSDVVERALLVQPEGFEVRQTKNLVLDLSSGAASVEDAVEMALPSEGVVKGSVRGSLSVSGDLLGPTISGLERLLRIPTGCGEQNMITLAPNVYVGKYLKAVGRLRPDLRRRIANNMLVGYGRELTYRHDDGAFSAFGKTDREGSTWLTAFVLKTFAEVQASGLISVDMSVLESAGAWLVALQAPDGSFASRGSVIHTEMMGGLGGGGAAKVAAAAAPAAPALTSYVVSALARAVEELPALQVPGLQQALSRAKAFLDAGAAPRAYAELLRKTALVQAGLLDANTAAERALAMSTTDESTGHRWWSAAQSPAQDVEMTGYGLLLLCHAGRLGEALQAARWLLDKRTASGGFSSTQDTVLALNALATYATAVAGDVDLEVELTGGGGVSAKMGVDGSNADVLQTVDMPDPAERTTVKASGRGLAVVVAEAVYNLRVDPAKACYSLDVRWFLGKVPAASGPVRACTAPAAECEVSEDGMRILNIGLFTGYSAVRSSLEDLRLAGDIKRFEFGDGQVDLYLEAVPTTQQTCVEFMVSRDFEATGLQARASTVYEYYAPERRGAVLKEFRTEEYEARTDLPISAARASSGTSTAHLLSTGLLGAVAVLMVARRR